MILAPKLTINLDFDGTCVTFAFPNIGKSIGAEIVLRELINSNCDLILFTMRSDGEYPYLTDAVNWFKEHDIPLYGIQRNPTQNNWTSSPKSYAQLMIDDSAVGCPLLYIPKLSSRAFVNWVSISRHLCSLEVFTPDQCYKCIEEIHDFFKKEYNVIISETSALQI